MIKQRIVTALLGLVVVFTLLYLGSWYWSLFVWLGTLAALVEFVNLFGIRWNRLPAWWGFVVLTLIEWNPKWHPLLLVQIVIGLTLLFPVILKNRLTITQAATMLIGTMYIGFGGAGLLHLRELPRGWAWMLVVLVTVWLTDTLAFFVGSRLQGPKLWPSISPGKTVSGAIGGLVGGALGAAITGLLFLPPQSAVKLLVIGLVTSIAGQLGDLVESAYKRTAGVKDSGNLLPGHGGMLDRIDSLLFAAPVAFYLITIGFPKGWL